MGPRAVAERDAARRLVRAAGRRGFDIREARVAYLARSRAARDGAAHIAFNNECDHRYKPMNMDAFQVTDAGFCVHLTLSVAENPVLGHLNQYAGRSFTKRLFGIIPYTVWFRLTASATRKSTPTL